MTVSPATRLLLGASAATLGTALALHAAGHPGLTLLAIVLAIALLLTVVAHRIRRENRP